MKHNLYVCNFADEGYKSQQQLNSKSAYDEGRADKVIEFHPEDLHELKDKFPGHFKIKRGYGLWFWKPYLVLKAFEQMANGDYLFYCDSGAIFIDDIHKLIPDLNESGNDMMVFEQPLLARCFTKGETYKLLECTDFSGNQLLGGYILFKKSTKSIEYMKSWLKAMSDLRVLSGEKSNQSIADHKDFIAHREDQSVLTILCKKWGINAHRDPSDFGVFPWQYMRAGGYHKKKYPNSHYPVILLCVRKNNPQEYEQNYRKAVRLHKLGLNNEFTARIKLLPMYMRHWGRLFAEKVGLGKVLDRLLRKNGK